MKRIIVFALFVWVCCQTMIAQNEPIELSIQTCDIARTHYKERKYQEALEEYLKVGDYTREQSNEDERQIFVFSQTCSVRCYFNLKRYEEGFLLGDSLLQGNITDSEKETLLKTHIKNGYYLALSYHGRQQYFEEGMVMEKLLPYADAEMMTNWIRPSYPIVWYKAGLQFYTALKLNEALECMEKACKGYHEIGDWKNEMKAWAEIGDIKRTIYDVSGAMEAYEQAGALAVVLGNDDTFLSVLINQYRTSEEMGNSKLTYELSSKIDSLADATDDGSALWQYYNYLGDKAKKQGNYSLAEHWYRRNEPRIDFSRLSFLYIELESFDEALKYAELHKLDFQSYFSESEGDYYLPCWKIAEVYKRKGDSTNCFQAIDSLFSALNKYEEPRERAMLYERRGSCYKAFKEYGKALSDYQTADEILSTQYGEDDGSRIMLLPLMGGMQHQLGHYEESEHLYQKYLEGVRNLKGEKNSDFIDALGYYANAEAFAGHIQEGCRDYTDAVNRLKQQVRGKMPYFTKAEREAYWKSVSELFHLMTPFALEAKVYQTSFTQTCYDGLVLEKAFLLASEQSTTDLIDSKGTDDDKRDFNAIADMRAKIKEWERNENEHVDSILYLTTKINRLETQLSNRCRAFGDMTTFMDWDYQKVKDELEEEDALIDFTDFVKLNGERIYAAYVVNKKQDYPLLKPLFSESEIDSLQIPYPDMYYESPFAEELYRLLWEPFQDDVKEGSVVYYVPSQLLFRIALESLPLEDGTLLGDHYRFIRLSSVRELAYVDSKLHLDLASGTPNAVLYGGLTYSLDAEVMAQEAGKHDASSLLAFQGGVTRGGSKAFNDLIGTKAEIDSIERILVSHQLSVKPYSGAQGTEESFLEMNGKAPQILHMATHGFYYTPDEAQKIEGLQGYKDAMLLSGLVMSGGNAAWQGKELPEGVLGGILTASDIARLDLDGMELAVLPACHSGNGKTTEEGLYGLQRAFKKAGVKTMVMSLWEVSDMVATKFMTCFYKSLLDKDSAFDKRKAFDTAKSQIREKYPEPYYWAGFVMLD